MQVSIRIITSRTPIIQVSIPPYSTSLIPTIRVTNHYNTTRFTPTLQYNTSPTPPQYESHPTLQFNTSPTPLQYETHPTLQVTPHHNTSLTPFYKSHPTTKRDSPHFTIQHKSSPTPQYKSHPTLQFNTSTTPL
jgi:hypothetical protein